MTTYWLTAHYHLPAVYMCRMPLSSPVAARALPTPGPATIRLALIRTAIELFGVATTRDRLFPVIRAMPIRIQPSERVAISRQQIRLYKGVTINRHTQLQGSIGYREVATAAGPLIISLQIEHAMTSAIHETLSAIGAWGSADSLACCEQVIAAEPPESIVVPLQAVRAEASLSQRYIGLATEFRDPHVTWEEIGASDVLGTPDALVTSLWVWPLNICEQRSNGTILRRCSHSNLDPTLVSCG